MYNILNRERLTWRGNNIMISFPHDLNSILIIKSYVSNNYSKSKCTFKNYALVSSDILGCTVSRRELLIRRCRVWPRPVSNRCEDIVGPMHYATLCGHLMVLEFMWFNIGVTVDDFRFMSNHCMRTACEVGHVHIVSFLFHTVGLTANEFRAQDNYIIRTTLHHGQAEVLRFLWTDVKLSLDDFRVCDEYLLCLAGMQGHHRAVDFIRTLISNES